MKSKSLQETEEKVDNYHDESTFSIRTIYKYNNTFFRVAQAQATLKVLGVLLSTLL